MPDPSPAQIVRPLVRTRQFREFSNEPPTDAELDAILEAARWTGSAGNAQAWRFLVIRDRGTLQRLAEAGMPQTRGLFTAPVAVANVFPEDGHEIAHAYDDGRATERMLVAATMLGLGGGISWIRGTNLPAIRELLGLPEDRFVRTIVALGHPTNAARAPKAKPGEARLPREQVVVEDRWPAD